MSSTTYDIKLRYRLDGKDAVKGADQLSRRLDGLSSMVSRVGMGIAGYFGAQAAGKALIGFNATVEETKNQIAGMFALTKKTNLSDELANADRMYANLQKRAASLPGTTEEYAKFAGMVTRSVTDAGLGMKALEDITVNAVVAAKAFGIEADVAARDIDQLMSGRFNTTDPFSSKLLGSLGYATEEGRKKVREMSKEQRAELLKTALAQKQITQLAEAQGATFMGRFSTVQDSLQQLAGKAGAPLFEVLKKELERIAVWFTVNKDKVEAFTKSVGEGLVKAFSFLKDVFGFIANNAGALIRVAGAFAAIKAANLIGGAIGGISGAMAGMRGSMAASPRAFSSGEGGAGIGKSLGGLATAGVVGWQLGAALREATGGTTAWSDRMNLFDNKTYGAVRALERYEASLDDSTRKVRERLAGKGWLAESGASERMAAGVEQRRVEAALIQGVIAAQAKVTTAGDDPLSVMRAQLALSDANKAALGMGLSKDQLNQAGLDKLNATIADFSKRSEFLAGAAGFGVGEQAMKMIPDYVAEYVNKREGGVENQIASAMVRLQAQGQEVTAKSVSEAIMASFGAVAQALNPDANKTAIKKDEKAAGKGNVSVTINKIEVQNDDPERYAFDLNAAFSKSARNPSRAKSYFKGAR